MIKENQSEQAVLLDEWDNKEVTFEFVFKVIRNMKVLLQG